MKKITLPLLLSIATFCAALNSYAQVYNINAGLVSGCSGTLTDSGGEANQYSANENLICTVLPGVPGAELAMRLVTLNMGTGDTLWIYDGSTVSAPLLATIDRNAWIGRSFFGASSGSLTLRFKSNSDDSVGQFSFEFACNTCSGIAPVVALDQPAIRTCAGNTLTLDASGTVLPAGTSVQSAQWIVDGGTPIVGFPSVDMSFAGAGVHYVALQLQLSNGCTTPMPLYLRAEVVDVQEATLTATPDSVCVGQTVHFTTELPDVNMTGSLEGVGGYIPDDQVTSFSSSVNVLSGSATITNIEQIADVTISMEHSYASDITITLTCPNGQSMQLFDGANGGGIWIGVPIDDKSGQPGEYWDYTFDPSITTPVFGSTGTTMSVVNSAGAAGTSYVAGTYAATGAWSALIGCPISGNWTLTIMDQAGADDGYVQHWFLGITGISADGLDQGFEAVTSPDCNNIQWIGPASVNNANDCTSASFVAVSGGLQLFSVQGTTTDGCPFSSSVFVKVFDPIDAYVTTTDASGGNLGSAVVHVDHPADAYTVSWSNGTSGSTTNGSLVAGEYWVQVSDSQGCSDVFPFLINGDVGIGQLSLEPFGSFYSPETETLVLMNNSNASAPWAIYNASGQLIEAGQTAAARLELNLRPLASGMYVLTAGREYRSKFVRP